MNTSIARRRTADLLSVTGAAVAGAAVGAWFADVLRPWAMSILLGGLAAHAVGMAARYRMDRAEGPLPRFWRALYIACWIAIGALVVAIVLGAAGGARA